MNTMQEIIDILKPNDKKKSDFTYKRIFTTKWYDIDDTEEIETVVENAVKAAVRDILEMEKNVFAKMKNT